MAIIFNNEDQTITLQTMNSTYQMKIDQNRVLLHTYYGAKTDHSDKSYLIFYADRGFSGNPHEIGTLDRTYSLDVLPQEYSCFGTGDYRESGLKIKNYDGSNAVELRYVDHEIRDGKYSIEGLPATYAEAETAHTLVVTLKDRYSNIQVKLLYGVIEEKDIITRAVLIENKSTEKVTIEKAASLNLDWQFGNFDFVTFYGKHAMEREFQRQPISHGCQSIGSVRGASSHHCNSFVMLCDENATEETGDCYGFSFVYSGEFQAEVSKDQVDQTRLVMGIHPDNFSWNLLPGASFHTPEVIMTYSSKGMGGVSQAFHKTIRENICRGEWKHKRRPVLINNWEGTYFDFTGDKLVSIAKDASSLGVELFVMDDGWFGKRDGDNSGLGDWFTNEEKLGCTLKELGEQITDTGMLFGIWFEPECVSEDSNLYRKHPEWAVKIPKREPSLSRNQLILDFSREDVQEYIVECMSNILKNAPISYVKWDFNRSICDKYSHSLTSERQGEMSYRFVLGLYKVLDTLIGKFPSILWEGCSGGGGRFDAGMLYYTPQIWCSDDTDAIERLKIQYGTSFGYPVLTMGAHVSACPNHQTGRNTPLSTRGVTAMSGTFGYELDVNKMTSEEKVEAKAQIQLFKKHYELLQRGNYYRLTSPYKGNCTVWQMAAEDQSEALINMVYQSVNPNAAPICVKLKGLNEESVYTLKLECDRKELVPPEWKEDKQMTGSSLMTCGLSLPRAMVEYQAWMIYVVK